MFRAYQTSIAYPRLKVGLMLTGINDQIFTVRILRPYQNQIMLDRYVCIHVNETDSVSRDVSLTVSGVSPEC